MVAGDGATIEPEAVVWFQDAFDVLMVGGRLSVSAALHTVGLGDTDVLFNGECNCFPKDASLCQEQKRLFADQGPHYFLNSGQFVGKVSTVKRLLRGLMRMVDEIGGDWPSTDQGAFMQFCFGSRGSQHHASRVGVRCIVDAGAQLMRTMIQCDGRQSWSEMSSPLDIPVDLDNCKISARNGQRCLTDSRTKYQATSLHFNGKGSNQELEIQKLKPFLNFALERSILEHTNATRCSYVYISNVFVGCLNYSRRCDDVILQAFDRQKSHDPTSKPSGTFETVCMRDGVVYSCLEHRFQHPPLATLSSSLCSVGRGLHREPKIGVLSNAAGHPDWACNRDGVQHLCVLQEYTARRECLAKSAMCPAGSLLCTACRKRSAYRLTVDQGMRVLGCRTEKYIIEARTLLNSRFREHGNQSIDPSVLSTYMLTSPSRAFLLRISLINQQLFVANLEHVADRARSLRVIRQLLRVLDFAELPDFDLIFHIGDGVPDCWPLEQPHVKAPMYVPVFVQDMWDGAGAILAPPRSLSEVDLAATSALASGMHWSLKRPKAVWRGSTTGGFYTQENWRKFPRSTAVLLSQKRGDILDAGFTNLRAQADDTAANQMQVSNMSAERLGYEELFQYQLLLSIDGNTVADRLSTLLVGGSAVIKQESARIEFWYTDLQPFVHFFPVRHDMSNLEHVIADALQNASRIMHMARDARNLVLDRMHPHCIMCYWMQLLQMYSGFMQRPIRPPADSHPIDVCGFNI